MAENPASLKLRNGRPGTCLNNHCHILVLFTIETGQGLWPFSAGWDSRSSNVDKAHFYQNTGFGDMKTTWKGYFHSKAAIDKSVN